MRSHGTDVATILSRFKTYENKSGYTDFLDNYHSSKSSNRLMIGFCSYLSISIIPAAVVFSGIRLAISSSKSFQIDGPFDLGLFDFQLLLKPPFLVF